MAEIVPGKLVFRVGPDSLTGQSILELEDSAQRVMPGNQGASALAQSPFVRLALEPHCNRDTVARRRIIELARQPQAFLCNVRGNVLLARHPLESRNLQRHLQHSWSHWALSARRL